MKSGGELSNSSPDSIRHSHKNNSDSLAEGRQNKALEDRTKVAIGYQIGGYTLVGLDLENRIGDVLGIHFGGGYKGFTAGIKLHVNPIKNSGFFNFSYKDGGLGLIKVVALEYGDTIPFSQYSDFGLLFQFGLARILSINGKLSDRLFGYNNEPSTILSIGLGLSF